MAKQFKKKKRNSLTIFSILLLLMLGVVIISWIIHWAMPGGFESTSGFIEYIKPAGLLDVLTSPIQGFIDAASVIVFLLLLSAFLKIVNDSRSLDAAIGQLFLKLRGKEVILIISVTLAFAVCGTTFGMCEATIPFYALLIPILLAAGFDSFTAFLVICFGAGIGVLASTVNPVLVTNSVNAINTGPAGDGSVTTSSGIV
jgi:uncharacterized ion transporter superfamily protein YfcC